MKKIIILFTIFYSSTSLAFFSNSNIERNELIVRIKATPEKAWGEQVEKITNISETQQEIHLWYPLVESAQNIQLYINSEGKSLQYLKGEGIKNEIIKQVKEKKDFRFFRFANPHYPQLIKSPAIQLAPGETITSKIKFEQKIITKGQFSKIDFFLNDGIPTQKIDIGTYIESPEPLYHFYSNLPSETQVKKNKTDITWFYSKTEDTPNRNPFFLFSRTETPTLKSQQGDHTYIAHFLKKENIQRKDKITFLIDRSGSFSNGKWKRVVDWIHYFLETFPEETNIRIGFFDEELSLYNENFQKNSFDFQKPFFNYMLSIQPVGKTNLTQAIKESQEIWDFEDSGHILFLITDEKEAPEAQTTKFPIIILNFSETAETPLTQWNKKTNGFSIKLFANALKMMEKTEWEQKWNNWIKSYTTEIETNENETDILPENIPQTDEAYSPFRVGRILKKSEKNEFPFIPRFWGQQRIAQILSDREWSDEKIDTILALGRILGIQVELFQEATTRDELQEKLTRLSDEEVSKEIKKLQREQNLYSEFKYNTNKPVYKKENNIWEVFDFHDKAQSETLIKIAPYSEAQVALFDQFPDLVWEGFSLAEEVDFCAPFRCISVRHGERTESQISDRAFFRDYNPNHWANQYLKKAVYLGLLEPEINGKIHADRGIDRGEFAQMVHQYLFDSRFLSSKEKVFNDIAPDSEFFTATQFLENQDILKGYPDGTFRPLQTLTRAEGVKILLASLGYTPTSEDQNAKAQFPDATTWEKPWVNEAFRRNIVRGKKENEFSPHAELTRAEALKILLESK